jgi:hypothetical protein
MRVKKVEFIRAFRFPGERSSTEELYDVEVEYGDGMLGIVYGDEVHDIPTCHVKRVIRGAQPSAERAKGKKKA